MPKQKNAKSLFTSLTTETICFSEASNFMIHVIITNQTAKKPAAQSRYAAVSKSKMKLNNTRRILPDEFTLNIIVLTENYCTQDNSVD